MTLYTDQQLSSSLKELGLLDGLILADSEKNAVEEGKPLSEVLLNRDLISEETLSKVVAQLIHLPFIKITDTLISKEAFQSIPQTLLKKEYIVPFEVKDGVLSVATCNPDSQALKTIETTVGMKVKVYYSSRDDIDEALSVLEPNLQEEFDVLMKKQTDKGISTTGLIDTTISSIIDMTIRHAVRSRASDIHIEPQNNFVLVRYRIDGELHDKLKAPKGLYLEIVNKVKVLSRLRIDEHLNAQDGRLQYTVNEEVVDIRVSILPITRGEKIVMRVLSSKSRQFALHDLGMSEDDITKLTTSYKKPFGMVLSTGPTGSGKTTTIYAITRILNTRNKNISTIEDPVEYDIPFINQIQVNIKSNMTFASGLRSILRQDPDIIFVGEIRDNETASIAINAATTGHLVLSTLHTNDASTSLVRLLDMGIEPYLISSTVNCIVGQRLLRKVCAQCKVSKLVEMKDDRWYIEGKETVLFKPIQDELLARHKETNTCYIYEGKGCDVCHGSGYHGRVGIFEVLIMNAEIRNLILHRSDAEGIRKMAVVGGMKTMLQDGIEKALDGITSLEEVAKAILY